MKVLVLVAAYPDNEGNTQMMYAHTRNIAYIEAGLSVDVLNFSCNRPYTIDGVSVIGMNDYLKSKNEYELLISHAPNIRSHYRFLKKFGNRFHRFVFFFHGHEVLRCRKAYPAPYKYVKVNPISSIIQDCYDSFKLNIWHRFFVSVAGKSDFIFVSNWMKEQFFRWTRIPEEVLETKTHITYNCVGKQFEDGVYDETSTKEYDFVTIRGSLDVSKYAIDVVNKLAKGTHRGKFLVIGQGDYFTYNKKADNIDWIPRSMSHMEIVSHLDRAKYALMPTKTDAQGVMMCEMAAYGIPVITSDISVCHEVFDGFSNAFFIDNDATKSLDEFLDRSVPSKKDDRFYQKRTVAKEISIILGTESK